MRLRSEAAEDFAAIRDLLCQAFGGPDEADLVERLRADGDVALALVAADRAILGHVLLSPMEAPVRALALAPLAVRPEEQRRGIGTALMGAALARAAAAGWEAIFVFGDPAYYRRFGFDPDMAAGFESPYSGPHLMAVALGAPLPVLTGRIRHAPAFGEAI